MLSASWVTDFLSNGSQSVRVRDVNSEESALHFGVLQGSMLGPRIFNQYAQDVSKLFNHHHLCHHLFAGDTQCHCSGRPTEAPSMVSRLECCAADVSIRCACRRQDTEIYDRCLLFKQLICSKYCVYHHLNDRPVRAF